MVRTHYVNSWWNQKVDKLKKFFSDRVKIGFYFVRAELICKMKKN